MCKSCVFLVGKLGGTLWRTTKLSIARLQKVFGVCRNRLFFHSFPLVFHSFSGIVSVVFKELSGSYTQKYTLPTKETSYLLKYYINFNNLNFYMWVNKGVYK